MRILRFLVVALSLAVFVTCGVAATKQPPTTVIFVRHAEKEQTKTDDPPLTAEGRARADRLATVLGKSGLNAILTSQFTRSLETAAPVERALGVKADHIVLQFSPAIPPGPPLMTPDSRAQVIRWITSHKGKTVLVVGHTNTIPDLIRALGGPEVTIDETEYNDLFVLTLGDSPKLVHLTYP